MSIFDRIVTLTKAALHEGLNKLEDPVLLTGQYLRDLEDEIAEAERSERELQVAAAVLERRKREYELQAETSENAAMQAMKDGNETAARVAVQAKLQQLESAQQCESGLEDTRRTLEELAANLVRAKEERARLKAKREELAARARQAAQHTAHAPQGCGAGRGPVIHTGRAVRGFERMEEKIADWEVQAQHRPYGSYSAAGYPADPAVNSAVDAELERLRQTKPNS